MSAKLLQQVRVSCKKVAEKSALVKIDEGKIPAYAASLPMDDSVFPLPDQSCHYLGHGDDTAAFFITLNAINFGSGYFHHLLESNIQSGYFLIASRLYQHFVSHGPLSSEYLVRLTPSDCRQIFAPGASSQPVMELMELFAKALTELGHHLQHNFSGSFVELVRSAGSSAEGMVQQLARIQSFADIAEYDEFPVKFYKRAQLTTADLFLAFQGQGHGRFVDIDCLTIFADNLVPHVLRLDGLLRYAPELLSRIDKGEELPAGSREEVEIRACALHCCELVVEQLNLAGKRVNALQLDQFLWNRGQLTDYRMFPRHRTRTIFY